MRVLMIPGIASFALVLLSAAAWGAAYPDRPVRLVLGFPPSGTSDEIGRIVAIHLQRELGVNIVVDNRPGAGGTIASSIVARADPDGYTITAISPSFITSAVLNRRLPYDWRKDFAPIVVYARGVANVVVVNPRVPAKSIQELVALAKSRKDRPLSYGSPGYGAVQHFVGESFKLSAGINLAHVPYKGQAPALTALMGGEIDVVFLQPPGGMPLIKAGKLRALGFAGESRWPELPDVPTVAESGVPGFKLKGTFHGLLAPAKTPERITNFLHAATRKALAHPAAQNFFKRAGWRVDGSGPKEFAKQLLDEYEGYTKVARAAKIEVR